jgi:uncharacterized integral membrane protein
MRWFQQFFCFRQFFLQVLKQCIPLLLSQRWVSASTKPMNIQCDHLRASCI